MKSQHSFDHGITGTNLIGRHRNLTCNECHNMDVVNDIFRDLTGTEIDACINCHTDPHQNKFGNDCKQCHNEFDFHDVKIEGEFNHDLTDFPLEGLHDNLDCRKCHTSNFLDPISFGLCMDCHDDFHRGAFVRDDSNTDCKDCHQVNNPFSFTSFDLERHQTTSFPLEGAHQAIACFDCHLEEGNWSFRDIGTQCNDCHEDFHDGLIQDKYYPNKDCTSCHDNSGWNLVSFDHSKTLFTLEGEHQNVSCRACHFKDNSNTSEVEQIFYQTSTDCYYCHENPHGSQFETGGITNCAECHTPFNWVPENFDHNQTKFPLEGKHAELECNACHKQIFIEGELKTEFKIPRFECIDCHS